MLNYVNMLQENTLTTPIKGYVKCEHGIYKPQCRQCKGASICEHNKRRTNCVECGGGSICEHKKERTRCKECLGGAICEHKRVRASCIECGGGSICEHKKERSRCIICLGSGICGHNKRRSICIDCVGGSICDHGKRKTRCKLCGGSELCKSSWCDTIVSTNYNGYCFRCCVNLFPDTPVYRNYKTKENEVVDKVTTTFPNFTWVADKRVLDGCSKRRPDLLLDMGTHIIIIEVDENRHADYDCSCENKRLMELSQDLQHRPIVFIRFNPDGYVDQDGNKIASCWKINNSLGIIQVTKNKRKEWANRIETLIQQIQYWVNNPTQKTIEIIELFY